ncbi:MAG: efflux RND transporter permease subunit, partial [Balneolaceae bacterium]
FVMYGSGIQLNIVSLSGLTLGIGLLLDNAIVVLENINRHMPLAPSVKRAAAVGTKEISLAVTASTFTTISVFLPLIFLGGFEGAFFQDQAYTLSISLLASLLVALVLLPVLVVQILERREKKRTETGSDQAHPGADADWSAGVIEAVEAGMESDRSEGVEIEKGDREFAAAERTSGKLNTRRFFDRMLEGYELSLQRVLARPAPVFLGALILAAAAAYFFVAVPKTMLPDDEPSALTYRIQLPGNTALSSSLQATDALKIRLENEGLGARRIQMEGGYTDQTNLSNLSREGLNKFKVTIPVDGWSQAEQVETLMGRFDSDFSGWTVEPVADTQSWSALIGADQPPVL